MDVKEYHGKVFPNSLDRFLGNRTLKERLNNRILKEYLCPFGGNLIYIYANVWKL